MAPVLDADYWRELVAGGVLRLADVRAGLESGRARWGLPGQWTVEELQLPPDGRLPNDIRAHRFRGRAGKDWHVIDETRVPSEPRTVADAARVSSQLPMPVLGMDVYEIACGTLFGEPTRHTVSYEWFTDTGEPRHGGVYEEAEAEFVASRTDPSAAAGSVLG